jgi:hypothetical protein
MTIGEELKNFRASDSQMSRLAVSLCIAAAVMLTVTAHTMTFRAEVASEKARAEFVPMWKRIHMPPAAPIYESPVELLQLTPPVTCVRVEGVYNMGGEWIRSWRDPAGDPDVRPGQLLRRGSIVKNRILGMHVGNGRCAYGLDGERGQGASRCPAHVRKRSRHERSAPAALQEARRLLGRRGQAQGGQAPQRPARSRPAPARGAMSERRGDMNQEARMESVGRTSEVRSRQGHDQQDEVIRLEELRKKVGYLVKLHAAAKDASEEFAEAVRAVAEASGLQAKVVRRFVVAKSGTTFETKKKEAEQLQLVFDEVT